MMLRGLRAEGKRLLTPELASGETPRWSEREYGPLLLELERKIALDALDHAVDLTLAATPAFEPAADVLLAPRRGRDAADDEIARRVAADPDPGSIRVVTSDAALAARAREHGAEVEGAGAFRRRLGI